MSSREETATHLDLSVRQINNLSNKGIIPKPKGKGGYDLDACRTSYIIYLRARNRPADEEKPKGELSIERERALNLQVDTRLKEIKEQQLRKELAPVDLIEWALNKVGSQIGAVLDAIPLKVKRRVPSLTASHIEIIRREIVTCQNAAAKVTVDLDEYEGEKGGHYS